MRQQTLLLAIVALAGCGLGKFPAANKGTLSQVDQGALHVEQRKCGSCHTQPDDPNAGTLSGRLTPYSDPNHPDATVYPPNLTPDMDTGLGSWSDDQIIGAIRAGFDDEDAELCPTMPRQQDMSEDEAKAIVAYLRSLPPVSRAAPESTCPPLKALKTGTSR